MWFPWAVVRTVRAVLLVVSLGVLVGASTLPAPIAADLATPSALNPLALYPRRPGAKYWDVEAEPGATARLPLSELFGLRGASLSGPSVTLTRWSVVPRAAVPPGLVPADRSRYRESGLVEGFSPRLLGAGDRVLHLEVRTDFDLGDVACVATAASDGAVALPLDPPHRFDPKVVRERTRRAVDRMRSSSSTTPEQQPIADVYLPIGLHTGRFYIACAPVFLTTLIILHAVWGIDV